MQKEMRFSFGCTEPFELRLTLFNLTNYERWVVSRLMRSGFGADYLKVEFVSIAQCYFRRYHIFVQNLLIDLLSI